MNRLIPLDERIACLHPSPFDSREMAVLTREGRRMGWIRANVASNGKFRGVRWHAIGPSAYGSSGPYASAEEAVDRLRRMDQDAKLFERHAAERGRLIR